MHRFLPSSAIAAALASALLATPAAAQQGQRNQPAQPAPQSAPQPAPQAPPGMTAERFGDWVVLCPKKEAPPGAICFMTQEAVHAQTKQGLAAIAIAKPPNRPNPMIGFNLPPQIDPNRPIGFRIDQGKPSALKVERCDAQKCSSESGLPKEILDQLVKGKEALVLFAVPNQEKPYGVAFSLKGFGSAFKALDRKRG